MAALARGAALDAKGYILTAPAVWGGDQLNPLLSRDALGGLAPRAGPEAHRPQPRRDGVGQHRRAARALGRSAVHQGDAGRCDRRAGPADGHGVRRRGRRSGSAPGHGRRARRDRAAGRPERDDRAPARDALRPGGLSRRLASAAARPAAARGLAGHPRLDRRRAAAVGTGRALRRRSGAGHCIWSSDRAPAGARRGACVRQPRPCAARAGRRSRPSPRRDRSPSA